MAGPVDRPNAPGVPPAWVPLGGLLRDDVRAPRAVPRLCALHGSGSVYAPLYLRVLLPIVSIADRPTLVDALAQIGHRACDALYALGGWAAVWAVVEPAVYPGLS